MLSSFFELSQTWQGITTRRANSSTRRVSTATRRVKASELALQRKLPHLPLEEKYKMEPPTCKLQPIGLILVF